MKIDGFVKSQYPRGEVPEVYPVKYEVHLTGVPKV